MKFSEVELPSNKKFGFFFTFVFLVASIYFFFTDLILLSQGLAIITVSFLLITILNPRLLLPVNKLWMRFGFLLSMIISPIVLGLIFFGLFTPYGLVMRLFGRDELRIRVNNMETYWKSRPDDIPQTDFTQQF
jgi:hypothetical protein